MVAYMNREAWEKTKQTGKAWYWSRSRNQLWLKGETSGHYLFLQGIYLDCDGDALLIKVKQTKGACHKGYESCFFRKMMSEGKLKIIEEKIFNPAEVYQ